MKKILFDTLEVNFPSYYSDQTNSEITVQVPTEGGIDVGIFDGTKNEYVAEMRIFKTSKQTLDNIYAILERIQAGWKIVDEYGNILSVYDQKPLEHSHLLAQHQIEYIHELISVMSVEQFHRSSLQAWALASIVPLSYEEYNTYCESLPKLNTKGVN